ncbi:MAG: FtsW/RodA/SpoVE family cell cycle protein [Lachnospiraceae bacterium]
MASRKKTRFHTSESYFDYSLLFIVLFLLGFGMVMIYSTSSYESGTAYLKKQAFAVVLGLVAMTVVARMDYHFWERFSVLAYVVSCVLLLLLLTPLGITRNGATRWLNFGISLQPAEVAKLGMILFLSSLICKMGKAVRTWKGFLIIVGLAGVVAGLIYIISSNLSSAIIVFGIAIVMVFVASPDYKKFIIMALLAVAVAAVIVLYIKNQDTTGGFRGARILAWLNPEQYASGTGFQTLQALYAIGSGGIFGKGLGQSMQKLGFIPEAQNDMIFSVICEELGLFGAIAVLLLFALLIWRCMIIANNAKDQFGAMLVVGVMGHLAIQVILNVAVVTNTIPNTGISLPFISYGGSSVMFLLIEIGLVLSVARNIELKEIV